MTRRRRIIRRLPPTPPTSAEHRDLTWVSTLLGIEHDPREVAAVVAKGREGALWLPDSPDVIAPPAMIIEDFLVAAQRALLFGAEKVLKTSIAAHIQVAVASGHELFGYFRTDRRHTGPVAMWSGEGGARYLLDRLDRVCALYGVRRRSLDIEVQTLPRPLNDPSFLYVLADQMERLQPKLVTVEPLYLFPPVGWDGARLTTFDVGHFSYIAENLGAVPLIGHHDKRGEGKGLRKSSGVGPSEWAGQWHHVERLVPWDTVSTHQLHVTFGGRGVGGGRWDLQVNDATLDVNVLPANTMVGPSGAVKPSVFDCMVHVLPLVFDGDAEMPQKEMFAQTAMYLRRQFDIDTTADSLRRKYVDELEAAAVIKRREVVTQDGSYIACLYPGGTTCRGSDQGSDQGA
jgi:hypothetical protein